MKRINLHLNNSHEAIGQSTNVYYTSGYAMVVHGRPKTPKNRSFWGHPAPRVAPPLYSRGHN